MPLDRLLPVPPTAPDEGDRFTATFAKGWLPIITGALAPYVSPELWLDPPSDIDAQVYELIAQLQEEVIIPVQEFPGLALHFHRDSIVIAGNAISFAAVSGEMFAGVWSQSAAQLGDIFRFPIILAAGTYQLRFNWRRIGSGGKLTLKIDNTTVISAFDTYGSTLDNQIADETITIAGDGQHTVEGSVSAKNASSSGYAVQLGMFYFRRTGD